MEVKLSTLMAVNELLDMTVRFVENDKKSLAEAMIREFYQWNIDIRNEMDFDKDDFMKLAIRFRELEGRLSNDIQIEKFRSNVNSLFEAIVDEMSRSKPRK
jgi:hypothetical protein